MTIGLCWLLGLTPALAFPSVEGAPRWSPDGHWVALTVSRPARVSIPEPGWIFENPSTAPAGDSTPVEIIDPSKTGLYVASTSRDDAWLIAESSSLIAAPEWSPDGRALAYARVRRAERGGQDRFEVVVHESEGAGRVLDTRPISGSVAEIDIAKWSIAWSPNRHYLAVGLPETPQRTVILRADNGRILKVVDDAYWPSWSPDSTHLALIRGSTTNSLLMTEPGPGSTNKLVDLGRVFQPVVWTKDGKAILCIARRNVNLNALGAGTIDYLRFNAKTGELEQVMNLENDPVTRGRPLQNLTYALDREAAELYFAREQEGQPSSLVRSFPKNQEIIGRSHPIDRTVSIMGLSLSPSGPTLALRFGPTGVMALYDHPKDKLIPFVPDDSARIAWLTLLRDTSRSLLAACLPPVAIAGKPVTRPTLFLVPGEIPANHEMMFRLKRLARIARPLCNLELGSTPTDPGLNRFLREARLFFDLLVEDYTSALQTLDSLDAVTAIPDQRLALLALRAQIFLGLGDWERAKEPIDYLIALDERVPCRFEITPGGVVLTAEPRPSQGWGRYLAQRSDDLSKLRRGISEAMLQKPPGVDFNLFMRAAPFGRGNFRAPEAPAPPPVFIR